MKKIFPIILLVTLPLGSNAGKFNPAGWKTNKNFSLIGSPKAKKGGTLKTFWSSFPPTLRSEGPNSNLSILSEMHGLVYESLLGMHPETLKYIPGLADYWKISADKRKFWFHINPKARWANGSPVTAEDVVETWKFKTRKDIKDPYSYMVWNNNFYQPVAESREIVSVRTRRLDWRLFMYFSGMSIFPAKELKGLTGDKYLEEYNWKLFMGSGPYELKPENIKKDQYVIMTRRDNWWGEREKQNIGLYNFDRIKWTVVMDEELAFEKFKKGELDFYVVGKAQRWKEECDFDKVKKGWIQKRKIYTHSPEGFSGYAFNMRKPPFNDRNVRKAFAHLINRERLINKLFFNEYGYLDTYFPGWGNAKNPKVRYNPRKASLLLKRAGFKTRNKEGWLTKNGKPFEITLEYGHQSWTRIHKVIQEDLAKAGIKMNLKLLDPRTLIKKIDERAFTIYFISWGGLLFPNPISMWSSELADKSNNTNITGFKDPRVDKLAAEYNKTFDVNKRKELLKKIDSLIFRQYPYALGWYADFTRVLYWNKFGHPKTYFTRIGDSRSIKYLWWEDPGKEGKLEESMKNNKSLPVGKVIVKPWTDGK